MLAYPSNAPDQKREEDHGIEVTHRSRLLHLVVGQPIPCGKRSYEASANHACVFSTPGW
jgi:hypothetical protein